MPKHYLGISLFILSMLLFSTTYALFKVCTPFLSNTLSILFVSVCAWLLLLPSVIKKGREVFTTKKFFLIALRTVFGLLSLYFLTFALKTDSLAEVILLNNTAPLFVPFIVWIWHRTTISHQGWIGLVVGFIGIILVLNPRFHAINTGLIFALLSGLSTAGLLVVTRLIAHEPFLKLLFYYFFLISLFLSPFLFLEWNLPPHWIWLFLFLASLALLSAQLTFAASMRHALAHEVAPFLYTSVIFSGLIDWIFWDTIPHLLSLMGMVVVCIGGIITLIKRKA
jgi:drug/metabolite transporter (DMT)-like permease